MTTLDASKDDFPHAPCLLLLFSLISSLIRSGQSSRRCGRLLLSATTPMSNSVADSNATPLSRPSPTVHDDAHAQLQLRYRLKRCTHPPSAQRRCLALPQTRTPYHGRSHPLLSTTVPPLGYVDKPVARWNHFESRRLGHRWREDVLGRNQATVVG
jgi:hypothetical protein